MASGASRTKAQSMTDPGERKNEQSLYREAEKPATACGFLDGGGEMA
jgi:hypothetical protein